MVMHKEVRSMPDLSVILMLVRSPSTQSDGVAGTVHPNRAERSSHTFCQNLLKGGHCHTAWR